MDWHCGGGINKMIPFNSGFKNFVLHKNNTGAKIGTYIMGMQQMNNDIWFMNIWDQVGKVNMQTGKTTLLSRPLLPAGIAGIAKAAISKTKKMN